MRRLEKLHWLAWHPHQRLWNWRLVRGLGRLPLVGRPAARAVVILDSVLLAAHVVARRVRRGGLTYALRRPAMPSCVYYIDAGTHREALQVRLIHAWLRDRTELRVIAYEASPEYATSARNALSDVAGITIRQEALVGPEYPDETVRLYRSGGSGKADSLFSERATAADQFDVVPAVRLSQVLTDLEADIPVLLRMNIEGAELFVIDDLIAAGAVDRVAGYYGLWDDLSKIDLQRDAHFRSMLRSAGIRPVTFNDRDLNYPLRTWAIRYDIETSLAGAITS